MLFFPKKEAVTQRISSSESRTVPPEKTLPTKPKVDSGIIFGPPGTPVQRTAFQPENLEEKERHFSRESTPALHGRQRRDYIARLANERHSRTR